MKKVSDFKKNINKIETFITDKEWQTIFKIESLNNPKVEKDIIKYINDITSTPVTKINFNELFKKIRKQYQENGIARWAVIEKESNLLIGWSGLKLLTEPLNGFVNVHELGYRFLPEFWGKGYATESGKAVLEYGFNKMNLDTIYACVNIENVDSDKILKEKLGFGSQGTFVDPIDNATCFWYELKKENYKN